MCIVRFCFILLPPQRTSNSSYLRLKQEITKEFQRKNGNHWPFWNISSILNDCDTIKHKSKIRYMRATFIPSQKHYLVEDRKQKKNQKCHTEYNGCPFTGPKYQCAEGEVPSYRCRKIRSGIRDDPQVLSCQQGKRSCHSLRNGDSGRMQDN